ncbi:MAG TPA: M13 family metallopeptidase N-terminal domain-containing protein, partial [Blastocatellia bacterium]|nr:M13 family metallopeptidase N-terminal domain-containing protein [Blastocatellia bacterium]
MNKSGRSKLVSLSLLLAVNATGASILAYAQTSRAAKPGIDLRSIATRVWPCQDFYSYANGHWLQRNPVPADRSSWGAGSELFEKNLAVLHQILEEAAKTPSAPKGSITRKVGDFYRVGMDEAKIEAEGIAPLNKEFARIAAIKDGEGLQDEIAHLHRMNINPVYGFFPYQDFKDSTRIIINIFQGGLGLPDRDYYINEDDKSKEIRKQYVEHVAKMFELLGDKPPQAAGRAATVMNMETRLAKASMTLVQQRAPAAIYHKMTLTEVSALTPGYSWNRYFTGLGI